MRGIIFGLLSLLFGGIAGLLYVADRLPDNYAIVETAVIDAPLEKVWPLVEDLALWEKWSPWKHRDPSIKNVYSNPSKGAGARQQWTSDKSGAGELTFLEVTPPNRILYKLKFIDFNSESGGELTLEAQANQTTMHWSMTGHSTLMDKVMWTVFGMEKHIREDFQLGFKLLNDVVKG